jgi:hypothetical protein
MSDGYQTLTFAEFERTMRRCKAVVNTLQELDREEKASS